MLRFALALSTLTFIGCASTPKTSPPPPATPPAPQTIEEAVANPARKPENVARDKYRHPVETLHFFGLQPDMTVVEINPGGGWYTEILQPLVSTKGKYLSSADITKDVAPDASADMVLTFRNVHNWMMKDNAQKAFNSFYKALKPGGVLGVVEHRANAKGKHDTTGDTGYVREADVIKFAKKAGFQLVAKSEINANPKDTKNYPEGVWTLPPTLRLENKDRDKYLAIGESDRMTMKFVKPATAVK
jgi:predicted methyltransferase